MARQPRPLPSSPVPPNKTTMPKRRILRVALPALVAANSLAPQALAGDGEVLGVSNADCQNDATLYPRAA